MDRKIDRQELRKHYLTILKMSIMELECIAGSFDEYTDLEILRIFNMIHSMEFTDTSNIDVMREQVAKKLERHIDSLTFDLSIIDTEYNENGYIPDGCADSLNEAVRIMIAFDNNEVLMSGSNEIYYAIKKRNMPNYNEGVAIRKWGRFGFIRRWLSKGSILWDILTIWGFWGLGFLVGVRQDEDVRRFFENDWISGSILAVVALILFVAIFRRNREI